MTAVESDQRKARVLLADDDRNVIELMSMALEMLGVEATMVYRGDDALDALQKQTFDLIICDQDMPGATGMDILESVRPSQPDSPLFILVTGVATIELAVDAMRKGAFHFLEKPFQMEAFTERVSNALAKVAMERENKTLRQAVESHYVFTEIIGTSKALQDCLDLARRAADQPTPVLILGESGTGKDLLARAMHFRGSRSRKAFVPINCGAIPENLIESEFFGHKKGAFTGAIADRRGCFEEADGGTLFLDEIGEMPYDLQVRLLRVLEERKIRRVGENVERPVDVRIIAATNRPLLEQVGEGKFRQDLYYRLNVLTIDLPPLRRRREDIVDLAEHYLAQARQEIDTQVVSIAPEAMEQLQAYDFPGNVRELVNILHRALLLCDANVLAPRHLPVEVRQAMGEVPDTKGGEGDISGGDADDDLNLKEATRRVQESVERRLIRRAIERAEGNHTEAARLLGISRASFYNKLKMIDPVREA